MMTMNGYLVRNRFVQSAGTNGRGMDHTRLQRVGRFRCIRSLRDVLRQRERERERERELGEIDDARDGRLPIEFARVPRTGPPICEQLPR